MPTRKPTIPKPPTPWAKKRKVQSQLQQPVVAKNSKAKKVTQEATNAGKSIEERLSSTIQKSIEKNNEGISKTETTVSNMPLSSKQSKPRKPLAVVGRRPDYRHALIGLKIGDELVFHKYPSIKAHVADLDWKVTMDGQEYEGIIAAAEKAYKVSGLTPPKRVSGLSEWRASDQNGVRLRTLYERLLPNSYTKSAQISQPPSNEEDLNVNNKIHA